MDRYMLMSRCVAARKSHRATPGTRQGAPMTSATDHLTHENHTHTHGTDCGHVAIPHGDHTDYAHDGHIHRAHGDHIDECNGAGHSVHEGHDHQHGEGCGHVAVPHDG